MRPNYALNRSIFTLLFLSFGFSLSAQDKYREVDSLIQTNSIINSLNALKLLDGKFQKDSSTSVYWIKYAQACQVAYKHEEAFRSIDKAIHLDAKNADAYYQKGRFYYEINKDLVNAIAQFDHALLLQKKGAYYFYRGIYRQLSDSLKGAMEDYDHATALNVQDQGLFRNYAILLMKGDDPGKALTLINKAIALDPKVPENYSTRAEIYLLLVDPEKCCTAFEEATAHGYTKPSDIRKYICEENTSANKYPITGDVLFKMEKYGDAVKAYTKAIELEKDSSRYYLNRGYCYYKMKDYPNAEKDYLMAMSLNYSGKDLLYDDLSLLYFDEERFDKTIEYASKRIELDPKNHVPYIDRGLAYRKLKKYKEAEKDFNTSLSIKPDFYRAFGYRGFLYLELGKYELALADGQKSVAYQPTYGYGYLVVGQAKQYLKMDNYCLDFFTAKKYNVPDADEAIKKYCK